ncbi:MAG: Coenzyme F420 hydrogenase/dehydrogenase, beta subunit C-terminal domain [Methanophagales archaeon]|nr:Coenzyme F420 hydrogenase/dehydrogenase, beta subunit C-terminal domain [Methanophagales archaeon]
MARETNATELETEERKYVRLPTFLEQGFSELKSEVVDKRICSLCGTCAAFCNKIKIKESGENEPKPVLVEEYDTICGICYAFCPRTFLPLSEIEKRIFGGEERKRADGDVLGVYRDCYAVRSKREDIIKKGQDGGAVTSLLAYALEKGIIDCAVITTSDNHWKPVTKVAKNYEELKEGAGTKYTVYPSVVGIREAMEEGYADIGFVGLPCQIQGLRKVQTAEQPYEVGKERIKLLIGLFCMENFKEELLDFVKEKVSFDLEGVKKFDIKGKELLVYDEEGKVHAIALDEIKGYESEGCSVCMDYTAELADISVGSVGSEDGWSTVFARTEKGEETVKGALEEGYIEAKEMEEKGLGLIRRLGESKRIRTDSEK